MRLKEKKLTEIINIMNKKGGITDFRIISQSIIQITIAQ